MSSYSNSVLCNLFVSFVVQARIANNENLNRDEQMQALKTNKKVLKDLANKAKDGGRTGKKNKIKKHAKWKDESNSFREAMKANRLISKAEREGKPAHYYL